MMVLRLQFDEAVARDFSLIIVDNTNARRQDYAKYISEAEACGYSSLVVEVHCESVEQAEAFAGRCLHNVPKAQVMIYDDHI
eukprot:SAG31_NODE_1317_length_8836_cov_3.151311_2_plen_82_part_00